MTDPDAGNSKPRFRAPALFRKIGGLCTSRMLLCFGLPLLPPSATLLGVAYGFNQDFGVFHILGYVLVFISVGCITAAICLKIYRKRSRKDSVKITSVGEANVPRQRSLSGGSSASSGGVKVIASIKTQTTSFMDEVEPQPRHKKKKKKDHRNQHRKSRNKLPPVKEEDGRARFEQSMKERDKHGHKLHKRTKSESKNYYDEVHHQVPSTTAPTPAPGALTRKHLKMLAVLNNQQGSQESLQRRGRSHSMSDIGDSASERLSIDLTESPRFSKRFVMLKPKIPSGLYD